MMNKTIIRIDRYSDDLFELCVQVISEDGETRLDHEDYHLTIDDLRVLQSDLVNHLEHGPRLRALLSGHSHLPT